ncbi:MAG: carboxypeptidase regulatory-like domain-containing protein [Burkholderiales bacterium]|nr:carboxypeptidase regulatory-like domain-containing protein [Burkholderiales bacterium]
MTRLLLLLLLPLLALATAAQAADARFQCGGIGTASQEQFKAEASRHDAMLTFAESNGAYLADVQVQVRDSKGVVVLDAKCDGPLMLLDLPAKGTYQVVATPAGHKAQSKKLATSAKSTRLVFTWPAT